MRSSTTLIIGTLSVIAFGVGHDIAANADVINGDDNDHTVSYVGVATAMTSQASSTMYVVNTISGNEYRIPPFDKPQFTTAKQTADAMLLHAIETILGQKPRA